MGDLQHCPSDLTSSVVRTGGGPGGQVICPVPDRPLHFSRKQVHQCRLLYNCYPAQTQMKSNLPSYSGAQARDNGISNSALGVHGTTGRTNQTEIQEGRGLQVGGRRVGCGRQREAGQASAPPQSFPARRWRHCPSWAGGGEDRHRRGRRRRRRGGSGGGIWSFPPQRW